MSPVQQYNWGPSNPVLAGLNSPAAGSQYNWGRSNPVLASLNFPAALPSPDFTGSFPAMGTMPPQYDPNIANRALNTLGGNANNASMWPAVFNPHWFQNAAANPAPTLQQFNPNNFNQALANFHPMASGIYSPFNAARTGPLMGPPTPSY